ncbi:MAG: TolC family protein [Ignavibacteriales bacterium]
MKYNVFILLLFFSVQTFAQKLITLEEAVKIALQNNSTLMKSINNLATSKKQVKNAYGNLLPNFGIQGSWSWNRISDDGGKQLDFLGNPKDIPPSQIDTRNWSLSAGGNVVLFDGLSNLSNINQAENSLESSKLMLEKLRQDVVLQTSELFYNVLNAKAQVSVREENLKYNQKLLETIQERNKLGSVAIADVYSQQVQLGNAELLLIQAQNLYDQAKNQFLNYLALDILDEFEFVDPYENINEIDTKKFEEDFYELGNMIGDALNSRPDYKSQKLTLKNSIEEKTIAKSGYYPRLSGNYSFSTNAVKSGDLFSRRNYNFGLTLSIPIFSNWSTELSTEFAEVQYQNTKVDMSALERQIKIEVKQGYLDFIAGEKRLEVSKKNVVAAEENRKINYERYSLGSGTILNVLQADRDYTQALTERINAKFEFFKQRDNLLNALGKLSYANFEYNLQEN